MDLESPRAIRAELRGQFERYLDLLGALPTHVDSHQHIHRDRRVRPFFEELADEHSLPLRDRPPVVFKGGFYGQWEYGVSDRAKVSLPALERILRQELTEGIYEMSCHPGFVDPEFECVYHQDREWELETLCDPRLPGHPGRRRHRAHRLPAAPRGRFGLPGVGGGEWLTHSTREAASAAPRARAFVPSPLALGFWLAAVLIATKAVHWGVPDPNWISLRDYAKDLPVSVHADLVFAAAYGLLALLALKATRSHPRAQRAAGIAFLVLGALGCLYAVASIQIFDFLRSPLTYPLLYLAGEMSNMRSSIGSFLTTGIAIALVLAPLAYVAAVRATSGWFLRLRLGAAREAAGWALLAAALPLGTDVRWTAPGAGARTISSRATRTGSSCPRWRWTASGRRGPGWTTSSRRPT